MQKYDILFSPPDPDFPDTFMDWAILEKNLSLAKARKFISDSIKEDVKDKNLIYAYRVVRHGEGSV